MPQGQKPYVPESKRDIIPKAGRTPFGKDKAPSTRDLEPRAKPQSAKRATPEEKQVVRRALREILEDRDEDVMDVVDAAVNGVDPNKPNPDY